MKIYNVGNRIMNTYIYSIIDGYVMVDTGYEHSLKSVTRKLNKLDIPLSEIKYVFLTHAHDDHAGFLKELLTTYPNIKVIINSKSIPILAKGQNPFTGGCSSLLALTFCKLMKLFGKGQHIFPAIDQTYTHRLIKILPENKSELEDLLQGKILFTPGHTSDSMSLKIDNIIFCGDAAMNGLPSQKRITIWIEDKGDFQNSWEVLIAEKAKIIYPAHGKPFEVRDLEKYIGYICKRKLYKLK